MVRISELGDLVLVSGEVTKDNCKVPRCREAVGNKGLCNDFSSVMREVEVETPAQPHSLLLVFFS